MASFCLQNSDHHHPPLYPLFPFWVSALSWQWAPRAQVCHSQDSLVAQAGHILEMNVPVSFQLQLNLTRNLFKSAVLYSAHFRGFERRNWHTHRTSSSYCLAFLLHSLTWLPSSKAGKEKQVCHSCCCIFHFSEAGQKGIGIFVRNSTWEWVRTFFFMS